MFGPHVNRKYIKTPRSILNQVRAAQDHALQAEFNAQAFQIFISSPRSLAITLRDAEAKELRAFLDTPGAPLVVSHGSYVDFPWTGKSFITRFIRQELKMCAKSGILGLVIHLGKQKPAVVAKIMPTLLPESGDGEPPTILFLETPHLKPENSHYETPEKLAELFVELRQIDPELCRIGLCIDTAHLWSCGVDICSFDAAESWLRRLESISAIIPANRTMFHLNDSYSARGSGADRHAPLLKGNIWKEFADRPHQSGLAAFVDYAMRHNTITILERNQESLLDDYVVLERLAPSTAHRSSLKSGDSPREPET